MTSSYPLEVEPSNEVSRMNREVSERYLELACWPDAEEEAEMESEWSAWPSRPRDEELIPRG